MLLIGLQPFDKYKTKEVMILAVFKLTRKLPAGFKRKSKSKPNPKCKYNTMQRRAFWTGFGAKLVRVNKRGSRNLLRSYYNGKQGESFRNGVNSAYNFTKRYK